MVYSLCYRSISPLYASGHETPIEPPFLGSFGSRSWDKTVYFKVFWNNFPSLELYLWGSTVDWKWKTYVSCVSFILFFLFFFPNITLSNYFLHPINFKIYLLFVTKLNTFDGCDFTSVVKWVTLSRPSQIYIIWLACFNVTIWLCHLASLPVNIWNM